MKKVIFTMLLVFSASLMVLSQGLSLGLRAGLNVSNVNYKSGTVAYEPDKKTGLLVGAYVKAMFSEKVGLQPEAYFSSQGYKLSISNVGTFDQKLNYVNIPVLLRYNIIKFINIHAGPQFGLLLSAKSKLDGGTAQDIKDQLKSSDLTIAFGAGLDLPMGISGGIRYNVGLSDISDDPSASITQTVKSKNFQVYVAYKLFGKD